MLFYARMAHHAAVDLDLEPISRAVANLDALRRPLALGPALHAHLGGVGIGGVGLGGAGWQLAMGRGRSLGWGYVGLQPTRVGLQALRRCVLGALVRLLPAVQLGVIAS